MFSNSHGRYSASHMSTDVRSFWKQGQLFLVQNGHSICKIARACKINFFRTKPWTLHPGCTVLRCVTFWIIYLKFSPGSCRRERGNKRGGATKSAALFTHFLLHKIFPTEFTTTTLLGVPSFARF